MKNNNVQKAVLAIFFFAVSMWFGGGIIRNAIAFDLFIPGTLELKPFLNIQQINYSIRLMGITSYYTIIGYIISFICALGIMFLQRAQLKKSGWLFMALIIFFLCSPIEFYQMYLDTKLVYLTNTIDFISLLQADKLLIVFRERFDPRLTAAGFLSFLSYITALLFLAWQPLKAK